ncbi:MAG: cadherin-like domain-containing protein [Pirellulales bacterium]
MPVAVANSYSLSEDGSLSQAAPGVLANDSDVEGNSLTAELVSGPAHATSFTFNADGSFTYVPTANWNGADSFQYRVFDGTAYSSAATVTLNVAAVNDAPTVSGPSTLQLVNTSATLLFGTGRERAHGRRRRNRQ